MRQTKIEWNNVQRQCANKNNRFECVQRQCANKNKVVEIEFCGP